MSDNTKIIEGLGELAANGTPEITEAVIVICESLPETSEVTEEEVLRLYDIQTEAWEALDGNMGGYYATQKTCVIMKRRGLRTKLDVEHLG